MWTPTKRALLTLTVMLTASVLGCTQETGPPQSGTGDSTQSLKASEPLDSAEVAQASTRQALFGDLHVHTRFSFDAFIFGTRGTPDDAYRFAKGEPIDHSAGFKIQMDRPLDFYAVTDHANFLGMLEAMSTEGHPLSLLERAKEMTGARTIAEKRAAFLGGGAYLTENLDKDVLRSTWQRVIDSAERFNQPGEFTTFAAYEYTSAYGGNLHRNVIFADQATPAIPFSRVDSINPEDLWDWMDQQRAEGYESLAIPHNMNASNGLMFALETFDGEPLDADYAEQRMRNEPLVEISQVKGTSETHPFLSPNDEWAEFEIFPYKIARWEKSRPQGSYAREAWGNGLLLEANEGFNPYRFGVVAATDGHNSAGSVEEDNYWSKVGTLDADGPTRGSVPIPGPKGVDFFSETYYRYWGASGLAGVWAEENTRESIYAALRRKETFGTSGPRLRVRLFGGTAFPSDLAERADALGVAYAQGVPQGGDLLASAGETPRFLAWAMKDPEGTPLQRLQLIKVWVEDDQAQEAVIDIACAGGAAVDPETKRCPDNGASVDITDCSTSGTGAEELRVVYTDDAWQAGQRALYYLRVLENPTCRWSTWDAVRAGTTPRLDLPTTIQERAWSSPIWVRSAN